MPRLDGAGRTVLTVLPCGPARRVSQWASPRREKWFVQWRDRSWVYVHWCPYVGYRCVGWGSVGSSHPTTIYPDPRAEGLKMQRRRAVDPATVVRPPLAGETKILAKFPQLVAFLRDTAYDDGTPRTPGYLWLSNRGTAFEVVLFDPDSGSRLPVIAATLDDVLALSEAMLRSPETPWLPDKYLSERLLAKPKKKSS